MGRELRQDGLRHKLLSLLSAEPQTLTHLSTRLSERYGAFRFDTPLREALAALVDAGLARTAAAPASGPGRRATTYAITPDGEEALNARPLPPRFRRPAPLTHYLLRAACRTPYTVPEMVERLEARHGLLDVEEDNLKYAARHLRRLGLLEAHRPQGRTGPVAYTLTAAGKARFDALNLEALE